MYVRETKCPASVQSSNRVAPSPDCDVPHTRRAERIDHETRNTAKHNKNTSREASAN